MTNFKNFDEFRDHLINHINDGKDIYVFGWLLNEENNYEFFNEDDDYEYYVSDFINFEKLLSYLTVMINKNEEYCIVFDKIVNKEEDDEIMLTNRIHIFRKID